MAWLRNGYTYSDLFHLHVHTIIHTRLVPRCAPPRIISHKDLSSSRRSSIFLTNTLSAHLFYLLSHFCLCIDHPSPSSNTNHHRRRETEILDFTAILDLHLRTVSLTAIITEKKKEKKRRNNTRHPDVMDL